MSEALAYRSTFEEFVNWIDDPGKTLRDITSQIADEYAQHMRTLNIAVSTHNRKIKRIRRVFRVLREYWSGENPFQASTLLRKEREEREHDVHRLSFTREQEQQLQAVLDDDKHKVMNKPEVRVIYYLGMFTGQRMKDCVLLRWNKINFNLKRIWVKQFKTGKEVTIPIAPKLLEVLQGALAWKTGEADYVCPNIATRYNKTNALGKVVICSDNFQALSLLQKQNMESFGAIYIDPPYNTDASKIIYKNNYEHSSWLALMHDRLQIGKKFLKKSGIQATAIDEYELKELYSLLQDLFRRENNAGIISKYAVLCLAAGFLSALSNSQRPSAYL